MHGCPTLQLYDLMTMAFKYQVLLCPRPKDILLVSFNHMDAIRDFVKDAPAILNQVDETYQQLIEVGSVKWKGVNVFSDRLVHRSYCRLISELRINQTEMSFLSYACILNSARGYFSLEWKKPCTGQTMSVQFLHYRLIWMFFQMYAPMTSGDFQLIRQTLLIFFQDMHIRVSSLPSILFIWLFLHAFSSETWLFFWLPGVHFPQGQSSELQRSLCASN